MEFDDALRALHPAPLEKRVALAFDEDGFHVFPALVEEARLHALRALCDAWDAAGGQGGNMNLLAFTEVHRPIFPLLTHPVVLSSVMHILGGPFALGQVAWREPRKGLGQQGLHADAAAGGRPGHYSAVTLLWILDAYSTANGPTRVVPGTHRTGRAVPKSYADPSAHHPGERLVAADAGSLLLFNAHLWHSGTRNLDGARRRVMQVSYLPRVNGRFSVSTVSSEELLGEAERVVLGLRVA